MNSPSNQRSDNLALHGLLTDDERRIGNVCSTTRSDCIKIIERLKGEAGVRSFLQTRQPCLDDRTGADLLQNDPAALLRHLRWMDAEAQSFHDECLVGDPCVERFARPIKKSQGNRVLDLLDELDRSAHE